MIVCDRCEGKDDVRPTRIDDEDHDICEKCRDQIEQWLEGKAEIISKEEHATWLKSISKE